jgi:hypothetical protein
VGFCRRRAFHCSTGDKVSGEVKDLHREGRRGRATGGLSMSGRGREIERNVCSAVGTFFIRFGG